MADDYILRGDDGQLYRVNKASLAAHKIGSDDPAQRYAGKLEDIANRMADAAGGVAAASWAAMPDHTVRAKDNSASSDDDD